MMERAVTKQMVSLGKRLVKNEFGLCFSLIRDI